MEKNRCCPLIANKAQWVKITARVLGYRYREFKGRVTVFTPDGNVVPGCWGVESESHSIGYIIDSIKERYGIEYSETPPN